VCSSTRVCLLHANAVLTLCRAIDVGFKGTKKKAKCDNRKLQASTVYVSNVLDLGSPDGDSQISCRVQPMIIKETTWGQGAVARRPIPSGAIIGEYFGELEPLDEGEDLRES
jgi:hypothetical protein